MASFMSRDDLDIVPIVKKKNEKLTVLRAIENVKKSFQPKKQIAELSSFISKNVEKIRRKAKHVDDDSSDSNSDSDSDSSADSDAAEDAVAAPLPPSENVPPESVRDASVPSTSAPLTAVSDDRFASVRPLVTPRRDPPSATPRFPLQNMNDSNGDSRFVSSRNNVPPLSIPTTARSSETSELKPLTSFDLAAAFSKVRNGRYEAVEALLLATPCLPVDSVDELGNSLLIAAVQSGHKRVAKLCLRRRADIDLRNQMGNTALHYACKFQFGELKEMLKKYGADDKITNDAGQTCYEFY